MTTTTIHHPSCPARTYGTTTPPSWVDTTACLCGPEAAAEDELILMHRTPDEAVLDVFTHVNQAMADFQVNSHGRGTPKGLLSCVLLDNEQLGTGNIKGSFGVQA